MGDKSNGANAAYPFREGDGLGLTKREYASIEMAKALIGTSPGNCLIDLGGAERAIAQNAIRMADALLAELAKEGES